MALGFCNTGFVPNGGNADTLDGIHAGGFAFNGVLSSQSQVDSLLDSGIYTFIGGGSNKLYINETLSTTAATIIVNRYNDGDANYNVEIAVPNEGGKMFGVFYRNCNGGVWADWRNLSDGGNAAVVNSGFFAIPLDNAVLLQWSKMDGSIAKYRIQQKLSTSSTWSTIVYPAAEETAYCVYGLTNGESYDFRLLYHETDGGSATQIADAYNVTPLDLALDATTLGGKSVDDFLPTTGGTVTGGLTVNSGFTVAATVRGNSNIVANVNDRGYYTTNTSGSNVASMKIDASNNAQVFATTGYNTLVVGAPTLPTVIRGSTVILDNGGTNDLATPQSRNISAGTVDLTAGVSALATGELYFVYE